MVQMLRKPQVFSLTALGCRTNQYEVEAIRKQLRELGCVDSVDGQIADICIINTCSVTEGADSSSRHAISEMRKKNPGAQIIVTGCMAEKEKESLFRLDGVTAVVANADKETLVSLIFPEREMPEFSISGFHGHTRAFVKVQDGCNSFCSYCIIPYVRGRSRSRSIESIVREVTCLVDQGFKEVVLTGINVGDYDGQDGTKRLSDLIVAVDAVDGLERLRISSIDPHEVDDALIDAIGGGRCTCPCMHIVLQSGSNAVLSRMNRTYTKQMFFDTIERLRAACSDFSFTTDVIVGFPGESDRDFEETIEVVKTVGFVKVHVFPFSARPKTKAYYFTDTLSDIVIKQRKTFLAEIADRASLTYQERFVGSIVEVLTEKSGEYGHTPHFCSVRIRASNALPNQLVKIRIVDNTLEGLVGDVVYA